MDDDDLDYNFDRVISPFWKLAESLSVVQAALLVIGLEPQGRSNEVERFSDDRKPPNYLAARDAILSAVEKEIIEGKIAYREVGRGFDGNEQIVDYHDSTVSVPSLSDWLEAKGFETKAFRTHHEEPVGFRDPSHPRYSPKLAAVVEAWENFNPESKGPGTPKQHLMKWLRLNAARFNLTDDEGRPSENVIEDLAKVANWATSGGAPKTKLSEPDPE